MKKDKKSSADDGGLRRRAEARLRLDEREGVPLRNEIDLQRLLHELQVHQIELEMQNEELLRSRAEVENGLERYTELYDFAPVGYLTLGRDGGVRQVNLTGASLLGVERARLMGQRFGLFVCKPDRASFKAFLERAFSSQEKEVCEVTLLKKGQGPLNVQITATVSQDGQECRVMMEDITERKQIENAQLFVLQCGWSTSGEDFFESLARFLAETLDMDFVCIDRLEGDGLTAKTVAVYYDGKFEDNLSYALKDTPCGDVVGKTICSFPRDVRHLFPRDVALQKMTAESYAGTTLWDSRGQAIGLIAVIGRQPRTDLHLAEAILKVVAIRAAAELERRQAEAETRRQASFTMLNPRPIVELDLAGHIHFYNPTAMQMFPDLCTRGMGHPWLADWESAMHGLRQAESKVIAREVPVGEKWHHQTMHLVENAQRVRIYGADITVRKQAEEALRKANTELERRITERTSELASKIGELRLANEELETRTKQLRVLAAELTLAEQRERKRLSQFLHDGLQQHLLSAKMRLEGVGELILDVDLKQTTKDIEQIIVESVQLSRSLNAALSPPILNEHGLSEGLKWLAIWMRDKHNFSVALSIETQPELPEDVKVLVFESVRELLVNAVKHSKVHCARVSLSQVNGGYLRIVVSDEGSGFDPLLLKPPGEDGGFGLFSVRERIGLIGGRVEIDSAPGKGSRLVLLVPHSQASTVAFSTDRICTRDAEPQEDTAKNQGTTIRVLLADDHAIFRKGLGRLLKNEPGIEVVGQANDGQEAIELAHQLKPDVILMDINMPRIDGIEASRIIHREYPDICIIGLSAREDQKSAKVMRDAGASDYKSKGGAPSELISAIRECILRQ